MSGKVKYSVNEDIFDGDNEKGFYIAGFAAADGNVTHDKRSNTSVFRIGLAQKDADHLEKIRSALNFTGPLANSAGNNSIHMNIYCSKKIIRDLGKNFNVIPNKTLILTFPERILKHPLAHHFMRGYFDGDGCFWRETNRNNSICFELLGTESFLNSFRDVLNEHCELNSKVIVRKIGKTKSYRLRYAGNGLISQISSYLYRDATIFLDRKYDIVKRLIV